MRTDNRLLSSNDWIPFAIEDYLELTKLALTYALKAEAIQSFRAEENEYNTISVYYTQDGIEKELDYDYLQLIGRLNGRQYLVELEEIFFSDPCIDSNKIIAGFLPKIEKYLRDLKEDK